MTVEPITGGTVSGSAINATVEGGIAYPVLYRNSTVELVDIVLYGNTIDEIPYLIQVTGRGLPTSQVTSLVSRNLSML